MGLNFVMLVLIENERCGTSMDIPLLSMMMSQSQVQQAASVSVMKHALGDVEQQGEAVNKLLDSASLVQKPVQQAIHPHLGHSIDFKV